MGTMECPIPIKDIGAHPGAKGRKDDDNGQCRIAVGQRVQVSTDPLMCKMDVSCCDCKQRNRIQVWRRSKRKSAEGQKPWRRSKCLRKIGAQKGKHFGH